MTVGLADSRRSKLMTAASDGEPFDEHTGLPASELRAIKQRTTWYDLAHEYLDQRWDRTPGNTRRTLADAFATITPALVRSGATYPEPRVLRRALYSWAFIKKAWEKEPVEEWRQALDPARRKRAAFNEVLNIAVEKGYFTAQVARLLAAVAQQRGRGPHLEAFFGCMYHTAMRPAEVIHLRLEQCHLPDSGWGMLNLSGGVVIAGKDWTDGGAVHEVHSLKRRAATATRPVPIPPQFVRMLRAHIERFGVAPDGRLFRNQAGNYVDAAAYGTSRARKYVLTRTELASKLAKRPYDLRHAGISFWLYSGVDPAECARRAGQSIEVLFRHYAKFLDGVREQANRLIEQSMQEWDRVSQGAESEG
ncbi:integrase [Streptomyces sp. NPDC006668]|uniref:integrase n=1 Tax=Streptomyces sp. NPDC006668 TaxID=3156903 RepID=UPI0033C15BDB